MFIYDTTVLFQLVPHTLAQTTSLNSVKSFDFFQRQATIISPSSTTKISSLRMISAKILSEK